MTQSVQLVSAVVLAAGIAAAGFTDDEITLNPPAIANKQAQNHGEQNARHSDSSASLVTIYTTKVDLVRRTKSLLSELGKTKIARQGQFSIIDRDSNTPHIKKVRVVQHSSIT